MASQTRELVLQIKADVEDIKSKLSSLSNQKIESPFKRWSADLAHLYVSAVAIVETLKNLPVVSMLQTGIRFNSVIEQTKIGFAGILTSIAEIRDSYGGIVDGQEKFNQALLVAERLQKDLQVEAVKSVATYEELVQIAQGIAAPFLSAGGDIKELSKFTVLISNAVKAIGLDSNQAVQEARDLLSGTIDINSQLARSLGITNQMVESWKQQGTLFEELQNRLRGFELAGTELQNSWSGLLSNAKDFFTVIAAEVSKPLFEKLKQDLKALIDYFIVIKDGRIEIREEAKQKIEALKNSLVSLYETVKSVAVFVTQLAQKFEYFLEIAAKTFVIVKIFEKLADVLNSVKNIKTPDINLKESSVFNFVSTFISNIGKLILALSRDIFRMLEKIPVIGAIIRAIETGAEKLASFGLKLGSKFGGALMTGIRMAMSNIGIVVFTALTAYDIGTAFWNWLDRSLGGAVTRFAQRIIYWIDKIITEIRGLIGKLPFGEKIGGLSDKELEEKRRVLETIKNSIENEGKQKPKPPSTSQPQQYPSVSGTKQPVSVDIDKQKQENIALTEKLKLLERVRKAYLDLYQTQLDASKLQDTEKVRKKIELEFEIEEGNYKDAVNTLLERKRELEKLLQLNLSDKDREAVKTELQNIYRQIEQADQQHYLNRLNIINNYSKEIINAIKNLNRELQELNTERSKDIQNLDSQMANMKNRLFEPLKNLPAVVKGIISDITGADLFGFSGFGSSLKQINDAYQQFFSALRSGAGIETLKELKNGFLEARNSMLSFLQGINPANFTEIVRAIGIRSGSIIEGFTKFGKFYTVEDFEQVAQRVSKVFGVSLQDAQSLTNSLIESFVQARKKVKEVVSTLANYTDMQPNQLAEIQNQLLGIQMQNMFTEKIASSLKQKTQEIFRGLQDAIKEQINSLEGTLQGLTSKLSENSKIAIKLDTSILDKQYQELVNRLQSTVIEIPARLKYQDEGQYR